MAAGARQTETYTLFFDDFKGPLEHSKRNVEVTGHTVNDEQQAYANSAAAVYTEKWTAGFKSGYKPAMPDICRPGADNQIIQKSPSVIRKGYHFTAAY